MSLRLFPTGSNFLLCAVALGMLTGGHPPLSQAQSQATAPTVQILRASEWKGASDMAFEACKANSGEYTLWVYGKGEICGVPREEADRVVMFRQPLPGVSPIRATSRLPAGRYLVWVYGAGDPGHPWINLCGKTCVKGELPATPGWVSLDSIEVRDMQLLLLKSYRQPDGHQLYVQAVVLSSSEAQPDWLP
jgi:hypothetical protein